LLTVIIAIAAYFFTHNHPGTAKFLNDKERSFIQQRLTEDSDATQDEAFNWANVRKDFTDIKIYLYAFGFHLCHCRYTHYRCSCRLSFEGLLIPPPKPN